MAHTYYEPTEYEQLLIAAGWVDAGSLDTEYLEYTSRFVHPEYEDDFMTYDQWISARKEWDAMNAKYDAMFANLDVGEWYQHEREANQLLRQMTDIEIALGY